MTLILQKFYTGHDGVLRFLVRVSDLSKRSRGDFPKLFLDARGYMIYDEYMYTHVYIPSRVWCVWCVCMCVCSLLRN